MSKNRKSPPRPEDDVLWQRVKRTVSPLKKGSSRPEDIRRFEALLRVPPAPPMKKPGQGSAIETNQSKKIRRGQVEIDAKIDLHDMTQASALPALRRAVIRAYNQNKTCLLVITGKGARLDGVLRTAFPAWINDPEIRPVIASYAQAHIRHGGSGAWYVFLRNGR